MNEVTYAMNMIKEFHQQQEVVVQLLNAQVTEYDQEKETIARKAHDNAQI